MQNSISKFLNRLVLNQISVAYITNNSNFCNGLENVEPNPKVLSSFCNRPSSFANQFVAVDANFKDVVGQSEKWS